MSVTSNISHTKIQRPDIQALGHTAREGEAEGGREGEKTYLKERSTLYNKKLRLSGQVANTDFIADRLYTYKFIS